MNTDSRMNPYSVHHDSAVRHVSGKSVYIDDIAVPENVLHGRVVYSRYAHARIRSIDTTEARQLEGVHAVLTWNDIPGENQMGPVIHDEPCLANGEVVCIGQAIALIAAESEAIARAAEQRIRIDYEPLEAVLDLPTAIARRHCSHPNGSCTAAMSKKASNSRHYGWKDR